MFSPSLSSNLSVPVILCARRLRVAAKRRALFGAILFLMAILPVIYKAATAAQTHRLTSAFCKHSSANAVSKSSSKILHPYTEVWRCRSGFEYKTWAS